MNVNVNNKRIHDEKLLNFTHWINRVEQRRFNVINSNELIDGGLNRLSVPWLKNSDRFNIGLIYRKLFLRELSY